MFSIDSQPQKGLLLVIILIVYILVRRRNRSKKLDNMASIEPAIVLHFDDKNVCSVS
jgi:hypothetical protein